VFVLTHHRRAPIPMTRAARADGSGTPLGTCSAATRGPVVRGCSRRRPRARRTRRACGRRSACRGA
jgi:hypothetical protein